MDEQAEKAKESLMSRKDFNFESKSTDESDDDDVEDG